ncbi:MAG TPA: uracil-DNA glycosylase [Candidatus Saccharimonadales bacterium]|nr:uracil-DNA glycosylase [Candidatus Saccharimonadales bacterium]
MNSQLEKWLQTLAELPDMPNVHNLYSKHTPEGQVRLSNLQRYFDQVLALGPTTLLIGEAPGYQGSYRTGVPFSSEAHLLGPINKFGLFGGPANGYNRVFSDERIWKEPSATVVQKTLDTLPTLPLIWATFPLHPHKLGIELSNRAPNAAEVQLGSEILQALVAAVGPLRVVAVGNVAANCLANIGIPADKVRHPSHGGATQFREQLTALLAG